MNPWHLAPAFMGAALFGVSLLCEVLGWRRVKRGAGRMQVTACGHQRLAAACRGTDRSAVRGSNGCPTSSASCKSVVAVAGAPHSTATRSQLRMGAHRPCATTEPARCSSSACRTWKAHEIQAFVSGMVTQPCACSKLMLTLNAMLLECCEPGTASASCPSRNKMLSLRACSAASGAGPQRCTPSVHSPR